MRTRAGHRRSRIIFPATVFGFVLISAAIAGAGEDEADIAFVTLAQCGAIAIDTERLACFDLAVMQSQNAAAVDGGDTDAPAGDVDAVLVEQMQTNLAYAQIIEDRTFAFQPMFDPAPGGGGEVPDMSQIMRDGMQGICPNQIDAALRLRCFDEYAAAIFLDSF